ncbi:MAG: cytochrome c-type biogenesis protein [Aeromonas sp.]
MKLFFVVLKRVAASALLALSLGLSLPSHAAIEVYTFDSDEQQTLFKQLTKELRCPKCQNQDISDSNAGLAKDLRDKTYQMVKAGQDKQAIVDYMVARYGNFILYNPPLMASTLILWLGPLLVVVLGAGVIWRARRKAAQAAHGDAGELSAAEQQRLSALLAQEKKLKDSDK